MFSDLLKQANQVIFGKEHQMLEFHFGFKMQVRVPEPTNNFIIYSSVNLKIQTFCLSLANYFYVFKYSAFILFQ